MSFNVGPQFSAEAAALEGTCMPVFQVYGRVEGCAAKNAAAKADDYRILAAEQVRMAFDSLQESSDSCPFAVEIRGSSQCGSHPWVCPDFIALLIQEACVSEEKTGRARPENHFVHFPDRGHNLL